MTAKDALVAALYRTGHTQESAARLIGWNGQQISQRLARNSMRADELLTLMDAIGVDVTFTVRKTGEVLREHTTGHGRRVHGTVDKTPEPQTLCPTASTRTASVSIRTEKPANCTSTRRGGISWRSTMKTEKTGFALYRRA